MCNNSFDTVNWGCVGGKLLAFITLILQDIQDRQNKANIFAGGTDLNTAFAGGYFSGYGIGFVIVNFILGGGAGGVAAAGAKGATKFTKLKSAVSIVTDPMSKLGDIVKGPLKGVGKTMRNAVSDTLGQSFKRVGKELDEIKKLFGGCRAGSKANKCKFGTPHISRIVGVVENALKKLDLGEFAGKIRKGFLDMTSKGKIKLHKMTDAALQKAAMKFKAFMNKAKKADGTPTEPSGILSAKGNAKFGKKSRAKGGEAEVRGKLEGSNGDFDHPGDPIVNGRQAKRPDAVFTENGAITEVWEEYNPEGVVIADKADWGADTVVGDQKWEQITPGSTDAGGNPLGGWTEAADGTPTPIPADAGGVLHINLQEALLDGVTPGEVADQIFADLSNAPHRAPYSALVSFTSGGGKVFTFTFFIP